MKIIYTGIIYMMPGAKGLNPHELAHKWVKDLETRPDMSIKVGCQSHDMRISGRIVGVRSTEQSVGIKVGDFGPDIIVCAVQNRCKDGNKVFLIFPGKYGKITLSYDRRRTYEHQP